jgi:hypothetical protein
LFKDNQLPRITFDGFNKLTFENHPSNIEKITLYHKPTGSEVETSVDIGTASTVNINETGTYRAEIKAVSSYTFTENVDVATLKYANTYTNNKSILIGTNIDTSYYATSSSTFTNNYMIGDKDYSISYWIKPTAESLQGESAHLWWGDNAGTTVMRAGFYPRVAGKPTMSLQNGAGTGNIEITPDVWHHL